MCGICGMFNLDGSWVSPDLILRMSWALRHRGPDGSGHFIDGAIGLGHRRLSIIDLNGGAQPIANEDGTLQIVFNGEIYNYLELRDELRSHGHTFTTNSDTEVILHGYEQWGADCVQHLNGIFAFAIWDGERRRIYIARDHLGVKPLYYSLAGNRFVFASEIKAILQVPEIQPDVDLEALSQLFTLRFVPSPRTLFHGIAKLPPGHHLFVTQSGITVERYWRWKPVFRIHPKEDALIEEYRGLIQDAVRLQMRSDVPVGLFLSSGIDSGALLAIMGEYSPVPIRTFTIGFEDGDKSNETADARTLATMFGADHEELIVSANDYLDYYQRYLWDLEEPVGNETAAAFHFVSWLASKKVKVALTGQGADEPWAGYHRYLGASLSQIYSSLPRTLTDGILQPLILRWAKDEKMRRGVESLSEPDVLRRLIKIYSFYTPEMKSHLFQPWLLDEVSADGAEARACLERLQKGVAGFDPLTQMTYIDTRGNLPDDLLMVGDKTAMANSLEARVPFLDYRIIEFAESLPPQFKLRGLQGKYLHKRAVEKWLPKQVVYRKKKGFANPVSQWLRNRMREFVRDSLLSESAAVNTYFHPAYIRKMVREHEAGAQNYLRHIYLLMSFELWHRQFMTGFNRNEAVMASEAQFMRSAQS